jgi:hypothetical protein
MNPITKLDYYIQSAVPAVYDDSLSYYELLSKVLAKVDELIDQSNDYFSEDITKHISTTLQEWYSNGKLADIINKNVFTDMDNRLTLVTNRTKGYVNAMEYENLKILLPAGGYDWAPVIQKAIDEAYRLGVNKVELPGGTFLLRSTLKIPYSNFEFSGQGSGTVLALDTDITAIECVGAYESAKRLKHTTLKDFAIKGILNTGTGIYLSYFTFGCKVQNVSIDEVKTGIQMGTHCYGSSYERVYIYHFTVYGMYVGRSAHMVQIDKCVFNSWRTNGYSPKGIMLWGGDSTLPVQSIRIEGCDFEGCVRGAEITGGDGLVMESCYFENNNEFHLRLGNAAADEQLRNYRISNCWMDASPVTVSNGTYESVAISVDGSKVETTGGVFENIRFGFTPSQSAVISTDAANPTRRGIKCEVYGGRKPPILRGISEDYVWNYATTYSNTVKKPISLNSSDPLDVSLDANATKDATKGLRVFKQMNMVTMNGAVKVTAIGKIGTLPGGYAPKFDQSFTVPQGNSYDTTQTLGVVEVKRDGTIWARTGDITKWYNLNITWLSEYRYDLN